MKKTMAFAAVAALLTLASCQKEETPSFDQNGDLVFTGTIGQDTKTSIDASNGKVSWVSGDEITITDAAKNEVKYTVSAIDAQGKATFTKKAGESKTLGNGPYTAVYGTDPSTSQTYSATAPSLPMSAPSTNSTNLTFAVSCGVFELNLTAGESITSIEVKGTPTGGSETTYTLTCASPVSIASGAKFYIAVPAGSYTSFLLKGENGAQCYKEKSGGETVAANQIQAVSLNDLHFAVQLWADGPWWATTNIGATSPADYGQYFAWGYTTGQTPSGTTFSTQFNTTNYPYKAADAFQDAATVNWGTGWSIPTKDDFDNLINSTNTSIENVTTGVIGIRIKGKGEYASNSIFLPAAGSGSWGGSLSEAGMAGTYWSNYQYDGDSAWYLDFDPNCENASTSHRTKCSGLTVRPVRESVTSAPTIPDGALGGVFSVSATTKVYFSKGNLYYDGSAFKFEDNQYSFNGTWSTSHVSHFFWSKTASVAYDSLHNDECSDTDIFFTNATATTAKSDFTANGQTGVWRTLSGGASGEWDYLLTSRAGVTIGSTSNARCAYVKVNDICGLLIFPDVFTWPTDVTDKPSTFNASISDWDSVNNYSTDDFAKLEAAGCAFLPAAGGRDGSSPYDVGNDGPYWSSMAVPDEEDYGYYMDFCTESLYTGIRSDRMYGASVRLVTAAQ